MPRKKSARPEHRVGPATCRRRPVWRAAPQIRQRPHDNQRSNASMPHVSSPHTRTFYVRVGDLVIPQF
jgi:hypothetical protein